MDAAAFVDEASTCPEPRADRSNESPPSCPAPVRGRTWHAVALALVVLSVFGTTACAKGGSGTALQGLWLNADQSANEKFCSTGSAITSSGGESGDTAADVQNDSVQPSLACTGTATWYDVEEFRVANDGTMRFSIENEDGTDVDCEGSVDSGDRIVLASDACTDSSGEVASDFGTVHYELTDGCLTTESPVVTRHFVQAGGSCTGQKTAESVQRVPAPTPGSSGEPAPASITRDLAAVPLPAIAVATKAGPSTNPLKPIADGELRTEGGKPEVLYIGGEFCPYCAAERWALTAALSKFGTFSGLQVIHSAESDVPTLTYTGSTYTSEYVTFTPVEMKGNERKGDSWVDLEKPTAAQMKLFTDLGQGSFPFIDFGGRYVQSGGSVDPSLLVGKTQTDIASTLAASTPSDTDPSALPGNVNLVTGEFIRAICDLTDDQPADVCSAIPAG